MRHPALFCLLFVSVFLSPILSLAQSPDPADEVQGRAIKIFGCEITPNVNALKNCLDKKIDDMIKDAARPLKGQIDDLRGTIDTIGRTPIMGCRITPDIRQTATCVEGKVNKEISIEVAKAQAQLNIQLRNLDRQKENLEEQLAALQKNNPLGPLAGKFEKDLQALAALGHMNLSAMHTCLAAASSAQRDMVQLTQRFVSNPPAFPPYLFNDIWRQIETNFDIVMQEQVAELRESAASGRLPQVDQVLDRAVRAMKKLADRDPAAKCLYAGMEPYIPAMKQAARGVQQQIGDRAMQLLQTKVLPAIFDPIGQQLSQVFAQIMQSDATGGSLGAMLPNQRELDRIIRGVAAEQLLRPTHVRNVAQKVRSMSGALQNPQQAQAALLALQKVLDKQEIWPEAVAIEVAMEILRFSGHKWIDSDMPGAAGNMSNLAASLLVSTKDTAGAVTEAACGLIPEVGGAICAIFQEMIEVAYNTIVPQASIIVTSQAMHGALDQLITEVTKAYTQGYDPRQARQNMGPFAAVVNSFPTRDVVIAFATKDRSVREMQLAVFDYNDSVRQFAETAVRR